MNHPQVLRPLLVLCLVLGTAASAQATRTWVSGVGDDANPCSRTAPCKTFAGAISKTAAGGEIDAVDSGGFGALTITKAITIDARAVTGGVLVSGTNGINVVAGANDAVTLRGLDFEGLGAGLDGVKFTSGKALHIEDCTIHAFTGNGINASSTTASPQLFVKNTVVSDNQGPGGVGILVTTGQAVLENVQLSNNTVGLSVTGSATTSAHDSVFAGASEPVLTDGGIGTGLGIGVSSATGTQVNLVHSIVSGNVVGIQSQGLVRMSDVMISHNGSGVTGNVSSFGNNPISAGNTTDGAPNATLPLQ